MEKTKIISNGTEILTATAILRSIAGRAPYFSLTGEVWRCRNGKRAGNDCDRCGMLHEEILKHFPELQPVADLHLSDVNGVPMHAVENGWHWCGGTKYQAFDAKLLASHLRVSKEEAIAIHAECPTKEAFQDRVEGMRLRWKAEADSAIEAFSLRE